MISAISHATPPQQVAQTTAVSSQKSSQAKSQPAPASQDPDTVQLSSAAQAALAASHEVQQPSAKNAQEASGGDRQSQRQLAKDAVAKASAK